MTTSGSAALEMSGAAFSYGGAPALAGVTGRIWPGESVALIGPNGAGKSTFIKAVLGLVPVVEGRLTVLGRRPADARDEVAYVPQSERIDPAFPVSVDQVVLMGRYRRVGWFRRPGKEDRRQAAAALERVGLTARGHDLFGRLSGGQRQRVLIARALAQQARLLLLDEPFNGVDAATQDALLDVIEDQKAQGVAVVMATHDVAVAHLACEGVCLLNRRLVAFGPTSDTLTPDALRQTYGGAHSLLLSGDRVIVES